MDLKPKNFLCKENADDVNNEEIYLKLTDFGFALKYDFRHKQGQDAVFQDDKEIEIINSGRVLCGNQDGNFTI